MRAMSGYHVADATGLIKLDAMENPYRLPPELRDALGRRLAEVAVNRYPVPSYRELKAQLRTRFGVPDSAGLVLGNGSDELITMLATLLAGLDATVLAPVPSFVMYQVTSQLLRLPFVGVPLAPSFALDRGAMLAAISRHRPALIFLADPNNPTGNAFDVADVEAVLQAAPGLVVLDEAYEPFAAGNWMARLAQYPNLAVLRTLSKLGLAGARLGFLAAGADWIEQLEKVRLPYNVGVLNEAAVCFALEHADLFAGQAAEIRAERGRLIDALTRLVAPAGLAEVFPSQANFVLVRVAGDRAGDSAGRSLRVAARMRDAGVLIKDVSRMHPLLAQCLRLTVGLPEENRRMLAALTQALAAAG
ncbi:MAG: histidinol-phosphate transaminase [Lautropia sp.]